jgi:uncharacterized protein
MHVLQYDPGDDLLGGVNEFVDLSGVHNGVVVSGIGTLRETALHMVTTTTFPPVETFPTYPDKAIELTSMQGVIASGAAHIHMTVSDDAGAVGGHLEPGCIVLYLAEVVVLEFRGLELARIPTMGTAKKLVPANEPADA